MPDIDLSFVEEYNADVHLEFRQRGSRFQSMTRKGVVEGSTVYWQKFGHATAQTKTRRGQHTFQAPEHNRVSATMADWYVPTMVDKLDLLKQNIDEKNAHVIAHVSALGQKVDEILITAMETGANATDLGDAAGGWDYDTFMSVLTTFQVNEVPDDGNRFCAMHPYAWAQALKVPEFANADYVGQDMLPFKGGLTAKFWMGTLWMPIANVTHDTGTTDVATNLAWHRSCVGHGVNDEISTNWDWENTYSAWSCVSMMSLGAAAIDDEGLFKVSTLSPKPA